MMTRLSSISIFPLLLLFIATGCRSDFSDTEIDELPNITEAPEFQFTNFDGSTITNTDLKGSVYIAYFFFTSCGGPCPLMNSNANVLQAEYAEALDFRIVGFSVDPERDSVERLAKYADRYSAIQGRWYMLRNSREIVAALASRGYLMGDASNPALHSTRFALVDRSGMIRGYYDGTDPAKMDELRAAIEFLLSKEGA